MIEVCGVGQRTGGGRRTLRDVSLTIASGELVAIIGGSGAGKTTLLDAIAGVRPPSEGEIRHNGGGGTLGYVPQDDIVHMEMPLRRTLRYAAGLRLPSGTSPQAAEKAVNEVLEALALTEHAGQRVGALSGGERKRASIAVELLTRPGVFYLDEPTSGLDPATAADLMRLLRGLADAGTTVIVTTHHPPDVAVCDRVAVLAPDGRLAFYGSPAEAKRKFQADGIEDIYLRLAGEEVPREWGGRFDAPGRAAGPGIGAFAQCALLTRRNLDLLTRNRLTLAVLAGSPLMVLAMFAVLFRPGAFSPASPSPSAGVMILFWIAFGGFFFGLTYGLLQICTELPVLRRERFTGRRRRVTRTGRPPAPTPLNEATFQEARLPSGNGARPTKKPSTERRPIEPRLPEADREMAADRAMEADRDAEPDPRAEDTRRSDAHQPLDAGRTMARKPDAERSMTQGPDAGRSTPWIPEVGQNMTQDPEPGRGTTRAPEAERNMAQAPEADRSVTQAPEPGRSAPQGPKAGQISAREPQPGRSMTLGAKAGRSATEEPEAGPSMTQGPEVGRSGTREPGAGRSVPRDPEAAVAGRGRRRDGGLRVGPYVLAKVAVLLPLLAVVDALMLGVLRTLDRLPPMGWRTFGALFVTLLLCSLAALALGLLVSAAVTDPAQATMALPMLCFPQVLFVGAILPVPVMAAPGRWLSYAMSNRWAFEGLGHSLGVERLWGSGRSPLGPPLLASYGDTFSRSVLVDWALLAGFAALFLAATCLVLSRRAPNAQ
ncbi:ATP-binding cassette domain-containing protein [Actinomadura litoris]|uniref:ATP-binding cassette domain-containing protein n=1 Tax=Actinomadura litoris TaxID=2678616 RepID=UPI001FA719B7|nr:ATP-binding cassette domain-containing protein [Actinomadura litoris]